MQTGSIFAPDRAQNTHNNFQDPIAFIKQGGANGVALIETLKVIGEKGVRITPDIMASGGGANGSGDGGIGTLLLLNLFRDQMQKQNTNAPSIVPTNGDKS